MEFLVLGSLQVRADDGRGLRVGAGKQRVLLAMLVLQAGTTVGDQDLIEAIWGSRPPRSAVANLRTYASGLRRLLQGGARVGVRLLTEPGGYRLEVDRDTVDVLRWWGLLAQADAAHRRGDLAEVVRGLEGALGLWRGAPLADLEAQGPLQAQVAALDEQRLEALEALVDARLGLGAHAELVVLLRRLVAEQPFRERFWEQLMLALYRSGRQADALAAYQEVRGLLVGELGVEPGPSLRRLERAVLAGDPALEPVPAGGVVPSQLPPDIASFTGRGQELVQLDRVLGAAGQGGPVVISAIQGAGGIGKSALAVHMAHRLAGRFPDGQLYVNLHGATAGLQPLAPLEVLGRFLRALGMAPAAIPTELEEATAAFRSRVADRRLLVVLDNGADAAQVHPLLPAAPACAVLVTSRRALALDGATQLHLDTLPPEEAVALLGRLAGEERVAAELREAAEVARLCGWLPLALRIAGARLAARPGWPVGALAERLADAQRRLDELEVAETSVRASLAVSYQQLGASDDPVDRAAEGAFGLLGTLDGPEVGVPAAARLLDQPEDAAERTLERLVDAQLLETPSPGRYRFHDLLRLYAREQATRQHSQAARAAALTRAFGLYVASAWRAFALLRPGDYRLARAGDRWLEGGLEFADTAAALDWLEAERANLLAAVQQAAATPGVPGEIAVQLAHALFGFFTGRSRWDDWVQVNQTALAVARRGGDLEAQAQAHNDLGLGYSQQGHYQEALACHQESLAIRRELGDRHGQAASLGNLGNIHERQGRYREALAYLEESLAIDRELGYRRGQAASLGNLGNTYERQGRHDQARVCQQESLAIYRELGDRRGQAASLGNLGNTLERQGRYREALDCQRESVAIFQELGDLQGLAESMNDLGRVLGRHGLRDEAEERQRESLAIYRELGDPYGQAKSLRELGMTLRSLARHQEAEAHWRQALAIFERLQTTDDADQVRDLLAGQGRHCP